MEEKNNAETKIYEIGYHILPSVEESGVGQVVSQVGKLVTENGGSIISEDFPKMRNLSYEVGKRMDTKHLSFNKAYFGWIKFEMPSANMRKIKEGMEGNENILRFLIVKTVRESTVNIYRAPITTREGAEEMKARKETTEKPEASEEEIDKSIDELVIEN